MRSCADFETLICDYVDGTLHGEQTSALESHLAVCPECAGLVRDSGAAVAFMERAAVMEPPPELITKILFHAPVGKPVIQEAVEGFWSRPRGWFRSLLQPRFAMGMAMTVLSFSMLGQLAGIQVRNLKPADLDPVKVWTNADNAAHRGWARAVKYYENLRLVYEIQTRLKEWTDQEEEERRSQPRNPLVPPSGSGPKSAGPAK